MSKIGLKYPVYKSETSQGVIAKAIQADIAITVNDVKLYADDAIAESDKSFRSGTLTLGVDDLSDAVQTAFLGHAVDDGEITASGTDANPYVGIGFYGVKNGGRSKKIPCNMANKKYNSPNHLTLTQPRATLSHLQPRF